MCMRVMVYMWVIGQLVEKGSLHYLPEPKTSVLIYLQVLSVDVRVSVTCQRIAYSVIP